MSYQRITKLGPRVVTTVGTDHADERQPFMGLTTHNSENNGNYSYKPTKKSV